MATIPKAGITTSSTIEAAHITNIIDALDGTTAVEIDITSTLDVTGTSNLATTNISGLATLTNGISVTGTSDLKNTSINGSLDLTSTNSELQQKLVQIDNTSIQSEDLSNYNSGTTFEVDLSQSTTNDITINLGNCPNTTARLNYWITFNTEAASSGATFQLNNDGSFRAYSLETNDNTGATINGGETATTAITELRYTTVQIVNRKNPNGDPYWYIEFRSDSATAFTIA